MSVYLRLWHGRVPKDQELDGWGTDGPVLGPLDWVHTTYAHEVKLGQDGDSVCTLGVDEDLLYYDGVWYGDWSVMSAQVALTEYASEIQEPDEKKAEHPRVRK